MSLLLESRWGCGVPGGGGGRGGGVVALLRHVERREIRVLVLAVCRICDDRCWLCRGSPAAVNFEDSASLKKEVR